MQQIKLLPRKVLIILAIIILLPAQACATENKKPFPEKINAERALYKSMMKLSPSCTMRFVLPTDISTEYINNLTSLGQSLYQIDNGVNGCKGDFASYSLYNGGVIYKSSSIKHSQLHLTLREELKYKVTKAQQKAYVTKKQKVLKKLRLSKKSGQAAKYNNVKKIYSWVTKNVNYDYSTKKSSAYNALIDHQSTCVGCAALFYDLCRDSGIPCRIIIGYTDTIRDGTHAWNIVRVGKKWYNCDPTWDEETRYRKYFLKGNARFSKNHIPYNRFTTKSFKAKFPVSSKDYASGSK